jgi:hypothetical protein
VPIGDQQRKVVEPERVLSIANIPGFACERIAWISRIEVFNILLWRRFKRNQVEEAIFRTLEPGARRHQGEGNGIAGKSGEGRARLHETTKVRPPGSGTEVKFSGYADAPGNRVETEFICGLPAALGVARSNLGFEDSVACKSNIKRSAGSNSMRGMRGR